MTLSDEQQKAVDRAMAGAWEKYYRPGMGPVESRAFKAAWAQAYFEGWMDGYVARISGTSITEGPADPSVPSRARKHRRKLLKECDCLCHDLTGGSIHWGTKCVCNGGQGFDDGSDHVMS